MRFLRSLLPFLFLFSACAPAAFHQAGSGTAAGGDVAKEEVFSAPEGDVVEALPSGPLAADTRVADAQAPGGIPPKPDAVNVTPRPSEDAANELRKEAASRNDWRVLALSHLQDPATPDSPARIVLPSEPPSELKFSIQHFLNDVWSDLPKNSLVTVVASTADGNEIVLKTGKEEGGGILTIHPLPRSVAALSFYLENEPNRLFLGSFELTYSTRLPGKVRRPPVGRPGM